MISYDSFIVPLFAKAKAVGAPLSGTFELTSRCTLDCKMCYIHNQKINSLSTEKSTEWWLNLARDSRDAGMLLLLLTGGEPMLRDDFDDIYIGAKESGLLVSINTNATLITPERIKLFKELPPQRVNITLYGTSEETYRNLCGREGAYEKVVKAVKELKAAGVNIKLNYSITPYNVQDIPQAIEFAKTTDVPIQPVSYMFPPVRGCRGEATRLTPEAAANAHFMWNRLVVGDEDYREILKYSAEHDVYSDVCSDRMDCRAGSTVFWVTYDGTMTPCGMLTTPSIKIRNFTEAWQFIRKEREKITFPKECSACSLRKDCDFCAAVSKAETGEFNKLPPYACIKARKYKELITNFLKTDKNN